MSPVSLVFQAVVTVSIGLINLIKVGTSIPNIICVLFRYGSAKIVKCNHCLKASFRFLFNVTCLQHFIGLSPVALTNKLGSSSCI